MAENTTTTYENVKNRARYLLLQEAVFEPGAWVIALCEELDRLRSKLDALRREYGAHMREFH